MTGYNGPDRRLSDRRSPTSSLSRDELVARISDRAAARALEDASARVRAWAAGLATEEQRWVAAAAADVVEGGR